MTEKQPPAPITATVPQFEKISGFSRRHIYAKIKTGELPSVMLFGRRLIDIDAYRRIVQSRHEGGTEGGYAGGENGPIGAK